MKINKKNIITGTLLIISLWILSAILISILIEPSKQGAFGDMFGSINALFSGLALFGIILSILIQHNELSLQRAELSETRAEFKTNRVTSILFKQIEFTNQIIINTNFDGVTIKEFVSQLHSYMSSVKNINTVNHRINQNIKNHIERHSETVYELILLVIATMENFDLMLDHFKISNENQIQMKRLFILNLNRNFHRLISMVSMVYEKEDVDDLDETRKGLNTKFMNTAIDKLDYYMRFIGKNKRD